MVAMPRQSAAHICGKWQSKSLDFDGYMVATSANNLNETATRYKCQKHMGRAAKEGTRTKSNGDYSDDLFASAHDVACLSMAA